MAYDSGDLLKGNINLSIRIRKERRELLSILIFDGPVFGKIVPLGSEVIKIDFYLRMLLLFHFY